jgi:hypothetical protein
VLLNEASFAAQIREVITLLEASNRDLAEVSIEDGIGFLTGLLTILLDESLAPKPPGLDPMLTDDFENRVREALVEYDQARISLAAGSMQAALASIRNAREAWERKPTPVAPGD